MRLILETCEGAISFIDDIIVNGRTKEELEVQTKANAEKQEEDEKKGVSTLWAIFSDREYLSNSNVIMAMAIKCLSSRQHQHKEFLYGSIPESRQSYPLAESICMLNQQRSSNLPQEVSR
ncbi:hypothetical protein HZH66_001035 [Vespula vulgaris]|uniref:Uncharacterized protein n=1 Tax=Vespula vulgaris TaxID=7454 RepID=A0A834KVP3_VESVU|nr:hypothetical protein HZH66_001035 [Vespula vulgaris]